MTQRQQRRKDIATFKEQQARKHLLAEIERRRSWQPSFKRVLIELARQH